MITIAKAVFEKWLDVLADGDSDAADEMISENLRIVSPRSRLFNEYYPGKAETLAEYYVRMHGHLLKDVSVYEVSEDGVIREIKKSSDIDNA